MATISPLYNLDQLSSWKPCHNDELCRARVSLKCNNNNTSRSSKTKSKAKTLMCHDFKGGYLDDKYVDGTNKIDGYYFHNWQFIDTFVYFSHHFITIPPPCWVNAAHTNGVKVLGTIITEWDEGAERCRRLLEDFEPVVDKLVSIVEFYGFEGWLINIENKIDKGQVAALVGFVKCLTTKLHALNPNYEVIWYDSVTDTGALKWQNKLNHRNKCYFDVCDGIFLNYTWKSSDFPDTVELAAERFRDVYVGVDVFGRGCPGGGGFNSNQALSAIREHDLSVAIFAPGWTYEHNPKDFIDNEIKFWNLLKPGLYIHGPEVVPLVTSFCQGWGHRLHKSGQVVSDEPWCNLSLQQYQPTCQYTADDQPGLQLHWVTDDGYNGGGSIQIRRTSHQRQNDVTSTKITLLKCNIKISKALKFSYTFKKISSGGGRRSSDLFVQFEIHSKRDGIENITFDNSNKSGETEENDWITRFGYSIDNEMIGDKIKKIKLVCSAANEFSFLLGQIALVPAI